MTTCWVCRGPAAEGRNLCAACDARQPTGKRVPVDATLRPAGRIAADPRIAAAPQAAPTPEDAERAEYARRFAADVAESGERRPVRYVPARTVIHSNGTARDVEDRGYVPTDCLAPFRGR